VHASCPTAETPSVGWLTETEENWKKGVVSKPLFDGALRSAESQKQRDFSPIKTFNTQCKNIPVQLFLSILRPKEPRVAGLGL
jgi:hypothetical protein